jgi:hypothetical protein
VCQSHRPKAKGSRRAHKTNSSVVAGNGEGVPEWGLGTDIHSDNNNSGSDSGVDSNDTKERRKYMAGGVGGVNDVKIAEGKIIFSYLPRVLPISEERLKTDSVVDKMESAFEYLQSSWTLLTSKLLKGPSYEPRFFSYTFWCVNRSLGKLIFRSFGPRALYPKKLGFWYGFG